MRCGALFRVGGGGGLKIELYTQKYLLFLATAFNRNIAHLTLTPLVTATQHVLLEAVLSVVLQIKYCTV